MTDAPFITITMRVTPASSPIVGWLSDARSERPFVGWLELMALVEDLVATRSTEELPGR